MSEEDAHKYITKYSMEHRITKMETAKKILND
jgi:AmiR/NasT family two-component response regulator